MGLEMGLGLELGSGLASGVGLGLGLGVSRGYEKNASIRACEAVCLPPRCSRDTTFLWTISRPDVKIKTHTNKHTLSNIQTNKQPNKRKTGEG